MQPARGCHAVDDRQHLDLSSGYPQSRRCIIGNVSSSPIDPRRGIRVAAEANYAQAVRLRRPATVFLAIRADELELEDDSPESSE